MLPYENAFHLPVMHGRDLHDLVMLLYAFFKILDLSRS